ncbi:hypothetical protein Tco_0662439 [Tanacetum coccineum]
MANLEFCDKHNMVAYLKKPTRSEGFQEITATVRTVDNGEQEITATVDGKEFTITEASVRRHLQLADVDGISVLPTTEIFDQLSLMGYVLTDDKLTFQKGKFSPQWRFLIHTILHCLSPKKTSWEQFSSNIATAIICLATNITFNFSKLIFDGMVKNLDSKYKFLMYPRFIQIFLDKNKRFLNPHNRKYIAPALTPKLFCNMKRGFSREHTPLFPSMLAIQAEEGEGSGHPSEPQPPPSTSQPTNEEPIPNVVSSSHQKTQTPRQALNQVTELPQTSEPIPNVPDEAVYEEWDDRVERVTTTAASLDAEQTSGNINRTQSTAMPNVPLPQEIGAGGSPRCQEAIRGSIAQTMSERVPTQSYDSPLSRVHTLGSDEGSMALQELTVLCTTLSKKVDSLEGDLKQTKKVYGAAYTKLIKKVKKLEKTIKSNQARRRAKIVVSDDEEDLEDSSKQGRMIEEIDQDARVTLLKELFETTMKNVNTFVPMETKDRGRALELAAGSLQATIIDSVEVGSSKRDAEAELDHEGSKRQKTNRASGLVQGNKLKEDGKKNCHKRDDLCVWNLVKERFSSTEPTDDKEKALWVELKRLFEPNTDDTLWKLQRYMHDPLKWRLYDTCGVHRVSTERGIDIFMLVEKEYPLSKGVLTLMLVNRLLV